MASVSDAFNYVTKAPGAKSRSYRVQVNPLNGSAVINPGDILRFDVPTGRGRNVFMDPSQSYIQFQLKSTDSAVMNLDGSAYAFINRLDTLSGGQILESISDYGHVVTAFLDAQMPAADACTSGSVSLGCNYAQNQNVDKTGVSMAVGSVTAQYKDFSLPLALSGVFSGLAQKAIPVGIMTDLRLELTIEQAALAVYNATNATPSWVLQGFTLNLQYIDLDASVAEQIYQANGGVYNISTEGFRTYSTTTPASRTSDNILIPCKFSSQRTLMSTYRVNSASTASNYWVAHRVNPFYSSTGLKSQISYAIGSSMVPQNPITYGMSELYSFALQAFHGLGNAFQSNRFTATNWQTSTAVTVGETMGTALVAVNLDSQLGKSKELSVGMNTLTTPVFLAATYPADPNAAHRVTSIAHYDAMLSISESGTVIRF